MHRRRRLPTVLALVLLSAVALTTSTGARGEPPPLAPSVQDALVAYLRDPAANAKVFLDAARQENGAINPLQALFLGDAALRVGRYRMAGDLFDAVREGDNPVLGSYAEVGMAWAALGRGRLADAYEHLEAAGTLNPALGSFTDVTMALVAAANGDPDGRAALAAAAARSDVDPGFREVAPLLDAYARYWAGDVAGAADAFTAFAVAHPDSRFADDALYAAAQAKQRAGRDAEALADLEALAGDGRAHGPMSSRLVALDGRALLREGTRRDRTMGFRAGSVRIADLLDGDGSRMARAALAARARESALAAPDAGEGARAPRRRRTLARGAATPDDDGAQSHGYGAPGAARATADDSAGSSRTRQPERAPRFPWAAVLTVAALLLAFGLWAFGRGRAPQVGSR